MVEQLTNHSPARVLLKNSCPLRRLLPGWPAFGLPSLFLYSTLQMKLKGLYGPSNISHAKRAAHWVFTLMFSLMLMLISQPQYWDWYKTLPCAYHQEATKPAFWPQPYAMRLIMYIPHS